MDISYRNSTELQDLLVIHVFIADVYFICQDLQICSRPVSELLIALTKMHMEISARYPLRALPVIG